MNPSKSKENHVIARCGWLALVSDEDDPRLLYVGCVAGPETNGIPCLTVDCASPKEIDEEIDGLYRDLEKLRTAARKEFVRLWRERYALLSDRADAGSGRSG